MANRVRDIPLAKQRGRQRTGRIVPDTVCQGDHGALQRLRSSVPLGVGYNGGLGADFMKMKDTRSLG